MSGTAFFDAMSGVKKLTGVHAVIDYLFWHVALQLLRIPTILPGCIYDHNMCHFKTIFRRYVVKNRCQPWHRDILILDALTNIVL